MWWIKKMHSDGVEEALMRSELIPFTKGSDDLPFGTKSETFALQIAKAFNKNRKNKGMSAIKAIPILIS